MELITLFTESDTAAYPKTAEETLQPPEAEIRDKTFCRTMMNVFFEPLDPGLTLLLDHSGSNFSVKFLAFRICRVRRAVTHRQLAVGILENSPDIT